MTIEWDADAALSGDSEELYPLPHYGYIDFVTPSVNQKPSVWNMAHTISIY